MNKGERDQLIRIGCERHRYASAGELAKAAGVSAEDQEALICALNVLDWGQTVAKARAHLSESMDFAKDFIRYADEAGVSRSFLARAAGVTRQTVYDTLKEKP